MLGRSQDASSRIAVPHPGGVAVELNELVWLWPKHTMRTSAKEWRLAEHLGRTAQYERDGEVRCVQPQPLTGVDVAAMAASSVTRPLHRAGTKACQRLPPSVPRTSYSGRSRAAESRRRLGFSSGDIEQLELALGRHRLGPHHGLSSRRRASDASI